MYVTEAPVVQMVFYVAPLNSGLPIPGLFKASVHNLCLCVQNQAETAQTTYKCVVQLKAGVCSK